tara:strand:- start:4702 stop:6366 length:1665 start_codon:yes stop_codon:yes gene_type:complete
MSDFDKLVEGFLRPRQKLDFDRLTSLVEEVISEWKVEPLNEEAPAGGRFSVHIPIPKLVPTEAWGDPNSMAREEIDKVFSAIRRQGSIKDRIAHVNSFLDAEQALKKAPGGKVNTLLSMMQIIESLQATLNDFNESSAGFVFEGFMAALTQGRQEAGRVGGTLPIEDFITGDDRNVSLKLLGPTTPIHGSFTNLVDYLFIRGGSGVPSIDYLVAYKDKEGDNVSRLGIWEFEVNRDNLVDMLSQTGKKNAGLLGKMAQPLKQHIANWQDSPEWRVQMAQILQQTPGYTWPRGMFNKNLDSSGAFDAKDPTDEPSADVGRSAKFDSMAARGARVNLYHSARTAGFEHSRENGPDFESWWANISYEDKYKMGLASGSKVERTRVKKDAEIGAKIKEKYFDAGVEEAEATMVGNDETDQLTQQAPVTESYFGHFHEREKQLMAEESALMEGGKGGDAGSQWGLTGTHISDLTSLLNTDYYGEINLSSDNIEAVAKIYIEKLGEDMMTLLQTTKEFSENIGVYFTAEDRTRGAEASRQAQDQGKAIVSSLAERKEDTE